MQGIKNRTISLLLKPGSYRCNMDCAYCFYKRVRSMYPGDDLAMDANTAEVITRKTLGLGCRYNYFCWQGGEPTLLGKVFFAAVVDYQSRYAKAGQVVGNSIQTNGTLIDEPWADFLADNGFFIGLSLDGPPEIHDRYRKGCGTGSFKVVMRAARLLASRNVQFNVLSLLTDANISQPQALYRFYRSLGLNHLQFIPCIAHGPGAESQRPFFVTGTQLGHFYCALFDLWLEDGFEEVSIRVFEDILIYFLDGVHTSCPGLPRCDSYFVVEHNGDVYPCDFYVYEEWKLGSLVEDSYSDLFSCQRWRQFAERKSRLPAACRACRWLSVCQGDCPRSWTVGPGGAVEGGVLCTANRMLLAHMEPHLPSIKKRAMEIRRSRGIRVPGVGRNQACPCGSGLKYKKCCGGK